MESRELRIGNLVISNFKRKNEVVDIKTIDFTEDWFNLFQPIPLTEEWLLKFGFRHIKNNWYNVHANGNTFNVYLFEDLRYRVEIVSQSIGVFKYVHTLQNLYFALTGTELTLNK